jgi:hypothetical protein
MALGSTQPLTEMSARNIPGGEGRLALKAENLTAICESIVYRNVGVSTSHSPMGLHGPLQGYLYLYFLLWLILVMIVILCVYNTNRKQSIQSVKTLEQLVLMCLFQVDDETNVLQDGTFIDLCGVTLLWRSNEGLEKSPVS